MNQKTNRSLRTRSFLLVLLCLFFATASYAQSPGIKGVILCLFPVGTFERVSSVDGVFAPVELAPGESVTVQSQLPSSLVNTPSFVQPLDGGMITSELTVSADGRASLGFQAGTQPGIYRLFLGARGKTVMIQFVVHPAQ